MQRQQSTPLSQQREDMFSASSGRVPSGQNVFRFGNQSNLGGAQPSQAQSSSADDFPPLNRGGGDMSQERAASLMSALGFGGQSNPSAAGQNSRTENGLLNALSANRGGPDTRSTNGMLDDATFLPQMTRPRDIDYALAPSQSQDRATPSESDGRQKAGLREDSLTANDASPQGSETRNPLGAIGNVPAPPKTKEDEEAAGPEMQDPLAGMPAADKWGLKGLRTLMNNYPDYNSMVLGIDPSSLGLDLASSEYVPLVLAGEPLGQG